MLSPIVSGTSRMASWGWDVSARVRWIERCLALGVSSFDHADIYGGYSVEALFGEALAAVPELRERIQIVTKCGIKLVSPVRPGHAIKRYDSARAQVTASVEASLSALRTDRIDVLLIHRPDALMDPDELADAFDALLHRRHPLVTHQIEFSPLQLQALGDGTLDQCVDLCLRPMIWSALAGGRLFSGDGVQALRVRAALDALAQAHGVGAANAAYAWILCHPARPLPITGASRIQAVAAAVAALSLRLTAEDWYRVWSASTGHEVA